MHYRPPGAPRIHFDEAGAGAAGGAAAAGAGAATGPTWNDVLAKVDPETIGHWELKGWKKDDPAALVTEVTKAWKGLERHLGAPADRIIRLPEKADDTAGWNAVRQKLGAPKEASEYDFSTAGELDQALADTLRANLHKAGTPKDAAVDVAKGVAKYLADQKAAADAAKAAKLQTEQTALKSEWGQNYDFNRLKAMEGVKRAIGGDDASAQAVINAMQDAIGFKGTMEFWRRIGVGTTEASFHEGGTTGNPTTMQAAIARKSDLMKDPDFAKRYLAGSPKEVTEMNALNALITGVSA